MRLSGESRALFLPGFISRLPKAARFSAALRLAIWRAPESSRYLIEGTISRSRRAIARESWQSHCETKPRRSPKAEGSGAPKGAIVLAALARRGSAPCDRCARLPALHSGACQSERTLQLSPGRASRDQQATQALPAPSIALKPGTWRSGRNTGGIDTRTARERGYKPRPQEPHSLHQSAVTGRRP